MDTIGDIPCQAALIIDFDIDPNIPIHAVVESVDSDRATMDLARGMRIKYVPFLVDTTINKHHIGGRYLFDTMDEVREYMRYTAEELEFEPGTKFWDRPFFSNIVKSPWIVIGAHNYLPLDKHYVNRILRFEYAFSPELSQGDLSSRLRSTWDELRASGSGQGLAALWFLWQPEHSQLAVFGVGAKFGEGQEEDIAAVSMKALGSTSILNEVAVHDLKLTKVFDRTSLNVSIWLPSSNRVGRDRAIHPTVPLYAAPGGTAVTA